MRYTVYLEVQDDGLTMAHVPALPGCTSTGPTPEMAVARVPDAITAYNAWLRAHNEQAPPEGEPVEIEVADQVQDSDPHLGDVSGLLPTDRAPLASNEVAYLMRLLALSRQDLLDEVAGLQHEVLRWVPPPAEGADQWCIDDILEHVSRAERVYTSRLSGNIFQLIEEARRAALERMARLSDQELHQITEHQGEYWTARKVFRRFLEHELEHRQHIAAILKAYNSQHGLMG